MPAIRSYARNYGYDLSLFWWAVGNKKKSK